MSAFPPIVGHHPKLMILGSMPGVVSLSAGQYYAHPRNAFWPIMHALFNVDSSLDYEARVSAVTSKGVCVWDVLHDCTREGSLDSNIVADSEQSNDFSEFLTTHNSLQVVAFNGQAARKIFNRHCKRLYDEFPELTWLDLPSTSPAYAAKNLEQKISIWRQTLRNSL